MEVGCPQCGRKFEVPEDRVNRPIKCLCKFAFRPSDSLRNQNSTHPGGYTSTPQHKKGETRTLSGNQEDKILSDTNSEISSDELDLYLSSLKQQTKVLQPEDSSKLEPEIKTTSFFESIEIEDRIKVVQEVLEEETQASDPRGSRSILDTKLPEQKKAEPPENPHLLRIQSFVRKPLGMISISSTGLGVLALSMYLVFSPKDQPKVEADPLLSQLLEPSLTTSSVVRPKSQAVPNRTDPKPQSPATAPSKLNFKNKEATNKASKTSVAKRNRRDQMLQHLYAGRFDQVINLSPKNSNTMSDEELALYYEANFLSNQRTSAQKKTLFDELESRSRKSQSTVLIRALALGNLIQNSPALRQKAISQLQSLQLTRPKDPLVYSYLGFAFEKEGKIQIAIGIWNQSLTLEPKQAWVLKKKENIQRSSGETSNAVSTAETLAKTDGGEYAGLMALASHQLKLNPKKTLQLLNQAESHAMSNLEKRELAFLRAEAFCQIKDRKSASHFYWTAFQIDSNDFRSLRKKADCELRLEDPARAARSFQTYLKRKPNDSQAWLQYGIALSQTPKKKPAIAALQRSLEIQESAEAHFQIAKLFQAENNKSLAREHIRQAMSLNPGHKGIQRLSSALSK